MSTPSQVLSHAAHPSVDAVSWLLLPLAPQHTVVSPAVPPGQGSLGGQLLVPVLLPPRTTLLLSATANSTSTSLPTHNKQAWWRCDHTDLEIQVVFNDAHRDLVF